MESKTTVEDVQEELDLLGMSKVSCHRLKHPEAIVIRVNKSQQVPGDESNPGELVQNINTLELLANGASLKEVELCLEGLAGEGGQLDQVLVQEHHPLHHLSHSLDNRPLTILTILTIHHLQGRNKIDHLYHFRDSVLQECWSNSWVNNMP